MGFFRNKGKNRRSKSPQRQYEDILEFFIKENRLLDIIKALKDSIGDLVSLTLVNKALWAELAMDHKLWRDIYLASDPLVTPDIR